MMEQKPLVILTGPTAVGKTALSIQLAKRISGEIISADSMQVYRTMDIGSAKISSEEMQGVPHHLIDVMEPEEAFHVVIFQRLARKALQGIYDRRHIPIITGGTGFYIQALLYDIDFTENEDSADLRSRLEELAQNGGGEALHQLLRQMDPESARLIHPNNKKRMIRAIEFYELTGTRISEHNETERQKESPYQFCYFVLNDDRDKIYTRIDARVDQMLKEGLLEEVKALQKRGCTKDMVSMQGLGYKELLEYLDGKSTLEEAIYLIKRDSRHFAKRQLTWFRREKDVIWLEKEQLGDQEAILRFMTDQMQKRGILENGSYFGTEKE